MKLGRDLAIGSVYTGYGTRWYPTQMDFLRRTTPSFDHYVVLYDANPGDFQDSIIVSLNDKEDPNPVPMGNHQHIVGMNLLGEQFRARRYKRYLMLDSDCFPVNKDWMASLDRLLKRHHKKFAAPVRYEELNTFAHCCALYATDPELYRFHCSISKDLLGNDLSDTMMVNEEGLLPLVRNNFWCRHPLIGGVYGGFFYHHGAGSRHFTSHAHNMNYYDYCIDMMSPWEIEMEFHSDPIEFVSKSAGRPI